MGDRFCYLRSRLWAAIDDQFVICDRGAIGDTGCSGIDMCRAWRLMHLKYICCNYLFVIVVFVAN